MDLKQLEYFVRVAELGSFTRASILLDVAQSALSRQVRLLELEFKQSLLLRNGRGVVTTDAGKLMLEYGRGILHQVERMKEELGRARGALVGNVALGLPPSLLKTLTVPIFREFKEQFPAATLAIREGLTTSMQESLVSGRLDIALLYNASPSPDIDLTPLFEEELFLVSRAVDHPFNDPISIMDLVGYPLIMPSRPNAIRMLIESELANYGLRPTVAFEVDGINAILDLVGEDFGYAILTKTAVINFAGNRQFHLRSVSDSHLKAKLSLAVNSHRQITATQRALIDLIRRVVVRHLSCSV
ncbi:LysR family transcriptional regulator [Azomonas agilis]|uniref:LysR family transcriptional regulator n=1 Tax=Azomonas agilis TaxID=116849 RepID=A0A562IYC4_9GAMM|nr:LysR substrate-binding domain-containing protein [Azomonas agilis]TWH75886.1 LysR family transcriptional regulator [Azomonas agilis]